MVRPRNATKQQEQPSRLSARELTYTVKQHCLLLEPFVPVTPHEIGMANGSADDDYTVLVGRQVAAPHRVRGSVHASHVRGHGGVRLAPANKLSVIDRNIASLFQHMNSNIVSGTSTTWRSKDVNVIQIGNNKLTGLETSLNLPQSPVDR
jgi:hypothetical protein